MSIKLTAVQSHRSLNSNSSVMKRSRKHFVGLIGTSYRMMRRQIAHLSHARKGKVKLDWTRANEKLGRFLEEKLCIGGFFCLKIIFIELEILERLVCNPSA